MLAVLALVAASPAAAQLIAVPDTMPDFVGVGVGSTTSYSGARQRSVVGAPGARYAFKDSGPTIEWAGPGAQLDLGPGGDWHYGPALNLRFGRSRVDDVQVRRLPDVDATVELGGFLAWTQDHGGAVPWRSRVAVHVFRDVGGVSKAWSASLGGNVWLPMSTRTLIGAGGGWSWADAAFMRTYYGIDTAGAAASGLPVYRPAGGPKQWYAWSGLIHRLGERWFIGVGAFHQRITGEASRSPVVRDRGSAKQWTYGAGMGYVWE